MLSIPQGFSEKLQLRVKVSDTGITEQIRLTLTALVEDERPMDLERHRSSHACRWHFLAQHRLR
jgi:P2-related tail formation protein